MVRLRNLHRAEDVTLEDSARPVGPPSAAAPSSSASGATTEGCGDAYAFNVTIAFAAGHRRDRQGATERRPSRSEVGHDPPATATRRSSWRWSPWSLVLGFWFLILAPKRAESGRLGDAADQGGGQARQPPCPPRASLQGARNSYAKDYETVVRLGKAVPASLDMPSLLVQLESAAKGTNIEFDSVKAGARTAAAPPLLRADRLTSGGSAPLPRRPRAGGAPAQTGAGKATEKAGEAKNTADQRSGARPRPASTGGAAGRRARHRCARRPAGRPRAWTACRWSSPSPAASSTWPTSSTA